MVNNKALSYVEGVLDNLPADWLKLTTHRLDIYNEKLAKTQFLDQFEILYNAHNFESSALSALPTAYDYIRLGHPLSCILEWLMAKTHNLNPLNVISFSSRIMPVLAILRKNLLDNTNTQIIYTGDLAHFPDPEILHRIYGYTFDLKRVENIEAVTEYNGSTVFLAQDDDFSSINLTPNIDFFISVHSQLGSIILVNDESSREKYISEIQHVRRRETITMTPADCLTALKMLAQKSLSDTPERTAEVSKPLVLDSIAAISGTNTKILLGSSGLSIQYAILMGLIHDAQEKHQGKEIKIVVPPNCYGGTNDQARRVAACIENVEIVDLLVDGDHDMVSSLELILDNIAEQNAIPIIIAEIPTNPRVEVPDFNKLKEVLSKTRKTVTGQTAIDPVFVLDQTFCPNVPFLGSDGAFSAVRTISYVSGSKFPSGGLCTAGYCQGNNHSQSLMEKIELHLKLCDNEATQLQMEILAKQLPSMVQRINDAYENTHEFVEFVREVLPDAKINFISKALARQGFKPSVFSLDLPVKGHSHEEKESYKRALNHKLIHLMITEIPHESKFCVSYGQLKGCYWTIPATSTQGTTKEDDKDYIVRVAISPDMDLDLHKKVFLKFIESI